MKKASKHLLILWLFFASTKVRNFRSNSFLACDKSLQLLNYEIVALFLFNTRIRGFHHKFHNKIVLAFCNKSFFSQSKLLLPLYELLCGRIPKSPEKISEGANENEIVFAMNMFMNGRDREDEIKTC